MTRAKTRIKKVSFHVGAYIGPTVASGASPGVKNIMDVEFVTLPEGIKGVMVHSLIAGHKYANFVPITNVTSSEVEIEPELPAPVAAKKPTLVA